MQNILIPWADVPEENRLGHPPGYLADRAFGLDLDGHSATHNGDMYRVYNTLCEVASAMSQHPAADMEGEPQRAFFELALAGTSAVFESIVDSVKSGVTKRAWLVHTTPMIAPLRTRPIIPGVRSFDAEEFVRTIVLTLSECIRANANQAHSGLDMQTAGMLMAPLYGWKGSVMKRLFSIEISGEVSPDELLSIMATHPQPGPVVSIPDTSAERPADADVVEALSGQDVLQWQPDSAAWTVFARNQAAGWHGERIRQPDVGAAISTATGKTIQTPGAGTQSPSGVSTRAQP